MIRVTGCPAPHACSAFGAETSLSVGPALASLRASSAEVDLKIPQLRMNYEPKIGIHQDSVLVSSIASQHRGSRDSPGRTSRDAGCWSPGRNRRPLEPEPLMRSLPRWEI
jgi:hypothetical protein